MLDKEVMLRKIREMPVEEVQKRIRQALDDSGIAYQMAPGGMSLSDFFSGLFEDEETTKEIELSGKPASVTARYVSPNSERYSGTSFKFQENIENITSSDWKYTPAHFAA